MAPLVAMTVFLPTEDENNWQTFLMRVSVAPDTGCSGTELMYTLYNLAFKNKRDKPFFLFIFIIFYYF
jgi:hypothetical protein